MCLIWGVFKGFIDFFGNLSFKSESSGEILRKWGGSKIQYFFFDQRNQSNAMIGMVENLRGARKKKKIEYKQKRHQNG